jgi:hypothetical protein
MKASIRDSSSLLALRPLEIATYLRAQGWRPEEKSSQANLFTVWTLGEDLEIVLPLTKGYGDFALRMSDLLQTLEATEERSQLEILSDLLTASADVIRLRIADADAQDGSLPLEEMADLGLKAREMMLAAACAAVEPRPYYPARKPAAATDYLRKLRVGQTERGSYVVKIISPVAPVLASSNVSFSQVEEPFERRATLTLLSALLAVERAAERAASTGSLEAFENVVEQGVSANLCEAIAELRGGGDGKRGFEAGFSWAPSRPVPPQTPRRAVLSSDAIPAIQEAGRLFREIAPREDFELSGLVVKLERHDNASRGKATILGFVDGKPRKALLELPDPEYSLAVSAHEQRRALSCEGELKREGRFYYLRHPRNLRIESEDE